MKNDLISRQAAIDVMLMAIDDEWEPDYATNRMNELPSAQPDYDLSGYSDRLWKAAYERGKAEAAPRWIPVTERLPEVDENVLVSYYFHGESEFFPSHDGVAISYWTGIKNHNILHFGDLGDASTVLAWMPLPEPYRKGAKDEQS